MLLQGSSGMSWSNLSDPNNGSTAVLIIFAVESVVFLIAAWCARGMGV